MKKIASLFIFTAALISASHAANAAIINSEFRMKIAVDNDFAVFSGTDSNIDELLYQNNVSWYDQVDNVFAETFTLNQDSNALYVLAMGGGVVENFGGEVNGVNLTDPSLNVVMSSDVSPFLSGYGDDAFTTANGETQYDSVAEGIYNAALSDVQAAFPDLTWGMPTTTSSVGNQQMNNQFGSTYTFGATEARLFRFSAQELNIEAKDTKVPEPETLALFSLAMLGMRLFRKK